ncbi:glycosyltransferase [Phaeobacter sp. HF9A]|uniref:glycosyltransferase n=1 Tax=Phaeobacter sp. HF9A TaxID=2721561 RepID=UPI00142FD235|nr:glycosyltransferase [Phaeobacter sp. HF9A]NIZ14045.1 glycosyltransferase [Phaeobacter sp. HF9A]
MQQPQDQSTLMIYAPVPVHRWQGQLYVEAQAANGLRLWSDHFARVIAVMPEKAAPPPDGWVALAQVQDDFPRVRLETVPAAYRPDAFLRALPQQRRRLAGWINEADYLSFAIGGLFGDWGAVCAREAVRADRPFAVWTDRVESELTYQARNWGRWRHRLRARLYHRPMVWLERWVISRAALGLFHGRETYEAYAPYCRNPQIVHDIHLSAEDHISDASYAEKCAALGERLLRLVYTGRADEMKGPLDWVEVLERLAAEGVDFEANFLGDGPCLPEMRARLTAAGLDRQVTLHGFVEERAEVLRHLRRADVFLFCHKTAESPRCLIEALTSATPIIGYEGAYARDLIAPHGGGILVPRNDIAQLSQILAELANSPARLRQLIAAARRDGTPFTDVAVFEHRSEVIKTHLPPRANRQATSSH